MDDKQRIERKRQSILIQLESIHLAMTANEYNEFQLTSVRLRLRNIQKALGLLKKEIEK